jgi:hypothetical protein
MIVSGSTEGGKMTERLTLSSEDRLGLVLTSKMTVTGQNLRER